MGSESGHAVNDVGPYKKPDKCTAVPSLPRDSRDGKGHDSKVPQRLVCSQRQ